MKRLLIVTAFFPPAAVIGSQRPLRLARSMPDHGWEPIVLTMAPGCYQPADWTTVQEIPVHTHVETVPCWSFWNHSQWWDLADPGIRRLAAGARRAIAKCTRPLVPVDRYYPWVIAATGKGSSMARRFDVNLIWATSPPVSCLSLARRIALRARVPYVADFRDVWQANEPERLTWRERSVAKAERSILQDTAGITYVAPEQIDVLCARHPFAAEKPHSLVYNWFDAGDVDACSPTAYRRPTILHGGALYGGSRRLDGFLTALVKLQYRDRTDRDQLQFLQLGDRRGDAAYISRLVEELNMGRMVDVRPSLPKREFLEACMAADILLLVIGHDQGGTLHSAGLPGKLYTYLSAGRPILVVGPPNCEAAKLVTRLNRGIAVEDDEPEQIASAIERLLRREGVAGPLALNLEAVRAFETSSMVGRMAEFLSSLCCGRNTPGITDADR